MGELKRYEVRLFCFHYAGGGASVFRNWKNLILDEVNVVPVELPGRGMRFKDPPYTRFSPLLNGIISEIEKYMDLPFAFFGHSMGALIAYELARELKRRKMKMPARVFVSGRCAPCWNKEDRILLHKLSRDVLIEKLRDIGGTSEDVICSSELMNLLLPTIRADFELIETYEHIEDIFLSCPIIAFGGDKDRKTPEESIMAWKQHTSSFFNAKMFPGGHFFVHESEVDLIDELNEQLKPVIIEAVDSKGFSYGLTI